MTSPSQPEGGGRERDGSRKVTAYRTVRASYESRTSRWAPRRYNFGPVLFVGRRGGTPDIGTIGTAALTSPRVRSASSQWLGGGDHQDPGVAWQGCARGSAGWRPCRVSRPLGRQEGGGRQHAAHIGSAPGTGSSVDTVRHRGRRMDLRRYVAALSPLVGAHAPALAELRKAASTYAGQEGSVANAGMAMGTPRSPSRAAGGDRQGRLRTLHGRRVAGRLGRSWLRQPTVCIAHPRGLRFGRRGARG